MQDIEMVQGESEESAEGQIKEDKSIQHKHLLPP